MRTHRGQPSGQLLGLAYAGCVFRAGNDSGRPQKTRPGSLPDRHYVGPRELLFAQQKTVRVAAAVIIGPYNVALRVDPERGRLGPKSRRYIDGGQPVLGQQKTMRDADAVIVASYNVAFRVDRTRYGCPRPRYIDVGKGAVPQKKTMRDKVGHVRPHNVALRVDPIRLRTPRSR